MSAERVDLRSNVLAASAAGVLVMQCSHNKPATITSWMTRLVVHPKSRTSLRATSTIYEETGRQLAVCSSR